MTGPGITAVPASIVPFEPTVAIAAIVIAALTLVVAFVTFLALAPALSADWAERLHATPTSTGVEANEAD